MSMGELKRSLSLERDEGLAGNEKGLRLPNRH